MRRSIAAASLVTGLVAALAYPLPASADQSGTTPVTLSVTTGTIDITVPTGPVSLGTVAASSTPRRSARNLETSP